jgi:polar amino acid transport system substrate-binding protein
MDRRAESAEEKISAIHFAEEANWQPFTPDTFGMTEEGLSFRLMREIFSRLGIRITVELFPQRRLLQVLQSGEKDGATIISKNAERLTYLDFTDPLFAVHGYLYHLAARKPPLEWNDFSDLKGLIIGTTAGHNYGDDFNRAVSRHRLNIIEVNREEQGFQMLSAGRLDAFLCFDITARQYLRDEKYKGIIVHASRSVHDKDYHIAFAKKSGARRLLPKVNAVIREMQEDGSLARLLSTYD